jgi:hypothetical protein
MQVAVEEAVTTHGGRAASVVQVAVAVARVAVSPRPMALQTLEVVAARELPAVPEL